MRKSKLPKREIEICHRLREAREILGVTQRLCAEKVGIERSTLTNYESAVTPVRYEVALRFCRQLIVSEEWLAVGKSPAMEAAGIKRGFEPGTDWKALGQIFLRQSMDLLSDPISQTIPPGTLFSDAYDSYLALRYAELAHRFFYTPRIILSESDGPELGANLVSAFIERWLKMLGNEALRRRKNAWNVQRSFIRALIEADAHIFRRFIGFRGTEGQKGLSWLTASLSDSRVLLGPLHSEPEPKEEINDKGIEVSTAQG